jgi:CDP-paratose 2-epimerase
MSCIYGRWQNGNERQGWVNWLARATLAGEKIVIYGDGLQVRDLLHVNDLVDALLQILDGACGNGEVFNIGGGPKFAVSIWAEFGKLLAEVTGREPKVTAYAPARANDQKVYVADIGRLTKQLGWRPRISPVDGIADMVDWLRAGAEGSR